MKRIAVIGSGVAGLGAAFLLRQKYDVTLFEQDVRPGGHSHTLQLTTPKGKVAVDTGFIVCNEKTYPNLLALFQHLGVDLADSDMSFAVSLDQGQLEYSSDNLRCLIGQWRNLLRPTHLKMISEILRFCRTAQASAATSGYKTLGQFLRAEKYSAPFINHHLLPMAAAIWSSPSAAVLDFPLSSFINFYGNHGLLEPDVAKRPKWFTVKGGSVEYVKKIVGQSGVTLRLNERIAAVVPYESHVAVTPAAGKPESFDGVVLATHADQALQLLSRPTADQKKILSPFRYKMNTALLHTDVKLMPKGRHLWASWNFLGQAQTPTQQTSVTYWMNRLQPLGDAPDLFVSLNPPVIPDAASMIAYMHYHHPLFTAETDQAQKQLHKLQGRHHLWFCGSYCGHGFHEDALASGLAVAELMGCQKPWAVSEVSPASAHVKGIDG